jgi:arylsulfatase A-like enzyme
MAKGGNRSPGELLKLLVRCFLAPPQGFGSVVARVLGRMTPRRSGRLWWPWAIAILMVAVTPACIPQPRVTKPSPARPDIVLILADDLAVTDLGAFGGEIDTPHIDALAKRGVRFTQFHTIPMCSPSRAVLMTGLEATHAGYGTMGEFIAPNQQGRPGYEGRLRRDVVTVAEALSGAGYATTVAGKWHLGEDGPDRHGFQKSWVLMDGASSHFDDTGYGAFHPKARYLADGRPTTPPAGFYSSDFYTDQVIADIKATPAGQPLFAYLAFTAPHWPLHAPGELIDKYAPRYAVGWDAVRQRRTEAARRLGTISASVSAAERPAQVPAWAELSPEEQAHEARLMAVYAAMVERLDWNVGRLVAALESAGRLQNTLIVVASDNGPEALDFTRTVTPGVTDWIAARSDNSLANLGLPGSYPFYGARWAHVGAAPHRGWKTMVTQGGLHTPLIIAGAGVDRRGLRTPAFATMLDIAPTLLEAAGARHQGDPRIAGVSLAQVLASPERPFQRRGAGFELFGNEAWIEAGAKVMRQRPPLGDGRWKLYDIQADPAESRDLAEAEPERAKSMIAAYDAWADTVGLIPPPPGWNYLQDAARRRAARTDP